MKLAATGITSGVGRRLAEMALAAGHEIKGLVRQPSRDDARALAALGVELIEGDLTQDRALDQLFAGADAAIHMAAHVGDWGTREEFRHVNVGGTRAALEAAHRGGVRRFVQLSSSSVYGRPPKGRITEKWPITPSGHPYDDTKGESERLAFERGAELGIEVAAVRPPVIYGPYDRNFMPRLLDLLRRGMMLLVDGGNAPMNLVWVDHVVEVLLLCCAHADAAGEAFNVMDTESERPPTVREVATAAAEAAGLPKPRRSVPYAVAHTLARAVAGAFRLVGAQRPPPITPFVVRISTLDVIYDASKAKRVLGWKSQLQPLDGVRRFAAVASRSDLG